MCEIRIPRRLDVLFAELSALKAWPKLPPLTMQSSMWQDRPAGREPEGEVGLSGGEDVSKVGEVGSFTSKVRANGGVERTRCFRAFAVAPETTAGALTAPMGMLVYSRRGARVLGVWGGLTIAKGRSSGWILKVWKWSL